MYCRNCGAQIEDNAKFCQSCGANLAEAPAEQIEQPARQTNKKTRNGARTAKLIVGIISIVLFMVIAFQSCAVSIGTALTGAESTSGGAGVMVALLMLISGIVGICTRNSKAGGITTAVFYAIAGMCGMGNAEDFPDLEVWACLCLIFAAIYFFGSLRMGCKKMKKRINKQIAP